MQSIHPSEAAQIITNSATWAIGGLGITNPAGQSSDFTWWAVIWLFAGSSLLCVMTYAFLHHYELTREKIQNDRRFTIMRERNTIAAFRFPSWLRTCANWLFKVGLPVLAYSAISAQRKAFVAAGILLSLSFFFVNFHLLLKWVVHPKSVFHRKHVFYKKDPTFIRIRLLFELLRRFIYFAIALTFISYGTHRLYVAAFEVRTNTVPLILLHLQTNLAGLTSLGSTSVTPVSTLAIALEVSRTIFAYVLLLLFVNIIATGISTERKSPRIILRANDNPTFVTLPRNAVADASKQLTNENALNIVEDVIEANLGIRRSDIKETSDLVKDLRIESLDLVELQLQLEAVFETEINLDESRTLHTVGDLVQFFMQKATKADTQGTKCQV